MKRLRSLVRWRRFALEERLRAVGLLLREVAELEERRRRLDAEVAAQGAVVAGDPAVAFTLGAYVGAAIGRRRALAENRAGVEAAIEAARRELDAAYAELKRYEIAAERAEEALRLAADRAEQARLDEVALTQHRRAAQGLR